LMCVCEFWKCVIFNNAGEEFVKIEFGKFSQSKNFIRVKK